MLRHILVSLVSSVVFTSSSLVAMLPMPQTKGIDAVMKDSNLSPMLGCFYLRGSMIHNLVKFGDGDNPDCALTRVLFLAANDGTIEYAPRDHQIAHYIPITAWARVMAILIAQTPQPTKIGEGVAANKRRQFFEKINQALLGDFITTATVAAYKKGIETQIAFLEKDPIKNALELKALRNKLTKNAGVLFADATKDLAEKIGQAKLWCSNLQNRHLCVELNTEWIILAAVWAQIHSKSDVANYFDALSDEFNKQAIVPEKQAAAFMNPRPADFLVKVYSIDEFLQITNEFKLMETNTAAHPEYFVDQPGCLIWMALGCAGKLKAADNPVSSALSFPSEFDMASGVKFKDVSFPDCGENALRKLFNVFLWDEEKEQFDVVKLKQLDEVSFKHLDKTYTIKIKPEIIQFYARFPKEVNADSEDIALELRSGDKKMHNFWAETISGLPKEGDHAVTYQKYTSDGLGCDFIGGFAGLQNVLFHLTGVDSIDAFMHYFGWSVDNYADGAQVRTYNKKHLSILVEAQPRHFIVNYVVPKDLYPESCDWPNIIEGMRPSSKNPLLTMLIEACLALHKTDSIDDLSRYPLLLGFSNPGLRVISTVASLGLLDEKNKAFPAVKKYIAQAYTTIPSDDEYSQSKFWGDVFIKDNICKLLLPGLLPQIKKLSGSGASAFLKLYFKWCVKHSIELNDQFKLLVVDLFSTCKPNINFWNAFFEISPTEQQIQAQVQILNTSLSEIKKLCAVNARDFLKLYFTWIARHKLTFTGKLGDQLRSMTVEFYKTLQEPHQKSFWQCLRTSLSPNIQGPLLNDLKPCIEKLSADATSEFLAAYFESISTSPASFDATWVPLITGLYARISNNDGYIQRKIWKTFWGLPANIHTQIFPALAPFIKNLCPEDADIYCCSCIAALKKRPAKFDNEQKAPLAYAYSKALACSFPGVNSQSFWDQFFELPSELSAQWLSILGSTPIPNGLRYFLKPYFAWLKKNSTAHLSDAERAAIVNLYVTINPLDRDSFWYYFFELPASIVQQLLPALQPHMNSLSGQNLVKVLSAYLLWLRNNLTAIKVPEVIPVLAELHAKIPHDYDQGDFWERLFYTPPEIYVPLFAAIKPSLNKLKGNGAWCFLQKYFYWLKFKKNDEPARMSDDEHALIFPQLYRALSSTEPGNNQKEHFLSAFGGLPKNIRRQFFPLLEKHMDQASREHIAAYL